MSLSHDAVAPFDILAGTGEIILYIPSNNTLSLEQIFITINKTLTQSPTSYTRFRLLLRRRIDGVESFVDVARIESSTDVVYGIDMYRWIRIEMLPYGSFSFPLTVNKQDCFVLRKEDVATGNVIFGSVILKLRQV